MRQGCGPEEPWGWLGGAGPRLWTGANGCLATVDLDSCCPPCLSSPAPCPTPQRKLLLPSWELPVWLGHSASQGCLLGPLPVARTKRDVKASGQPPTATCCPPQASSLALCWLQHPRSSAHPAPSPGSRQGPVAHAGPGTVRPTQPAGDSGGRSRPGRSLQSRTKASLGWVGWAWREVITGLKNAVLPPVAPAPSRRRWRQGQPAPQGTETAPAPQRPQEPTRGPVPDRGRDSGCRVGATLAPE